MNFKTLLTINLFLAITVASYATRLQLIPLGTEIETKKWCWKEGNRNQCYIKKKSPEETIANDYKIGNQIWDAYRKGIYIYSMFCLIINKKRLSTLYKKFIHQ